MTEYKRSRSRTEVDVFTVLTENENRARSSSLSPKNIRVPRNNNRVKKTKTNELFNTDGYDFEIPSFKLSPYTEKRSRSSTLIEDFDLSLYNDVKLKEEIVHLRINEDKITNIANKSKNPNEIGCLTGNITYEEEKQILKIKCNELIINHRPFENCKVTKNEKWKNEMIKVELCNSTRSPYNGRKISVFKSQPHTVYDVLLKKELKIPFKSKNPKHYSLKFTIYHQHAVSPDLEIGFVTLPLASIIENVDKANKVDEIVLPYAKKDSDSKYGQLKTLITWNDKIDLLELQLRSINNMNTLNTTRDKQIFVKVLIYVGNSVIVEYTTPTFRGKKNMKLDQKFFIELTEKQLGKMTISIQVYEKHILSSERVSKVNIGPYMLPTLDDYTLSCWEKMLLFPYKTIEFTGDLFS